MRAYEFIINESLNKTDQTTIQGGHVYTMSVADDRFIHFTTLDRAKEIVQSGKLLMKPPYKKFGIDAVTAVSLIYGENVPGVQTTHSKGNLVGILFETNTKPQYGHVEEVVWEQDVIIKNHKIVRMNTGVNMLNRVPYPITGDDQVQYI